MEPHTTYLELQYIDGLGAWSEYKYKRMDLLKKYIASCSKRVNWDALNKSEVVEHAWKALNEERELLNG